MQRTTIAANEHEKLKLQLARVIGLPLGQKFELDPALPALPEADLSLEGAVARAYAGRAIPGCLERIRAAESRGP